MATAKYIERLQTSGRNDICPCGSGKKYKKCHMPKDQEAEHKAHSKKVAQTLKDQQEAASGEETKKETKLDFASPKPGSVHHIKGKTNMVGQKRNIPRKAV